MGQALSLRALATSSAILPMIGRGFWLFGESESRYKGTSEGGYTQLTDYIRAWRQDASSPAGKHAFVPLKFRWGEAFQFDWSEESLVVGGVYRRLQVAHTKLCASRAFLLAAYPSQSHEMLFDAHRRAFQAFGGVPLRGISATAPALPYLLHPCSRTTT